MATSNAARRSGNPALRAAAADESRDDFEDETVLEAEAEEARATFEFAGEVYVLQRVPQDFKLTGFIRLAEHSQNTDAIELAIGAKQYKRLEDDIIDIGDFAEVLELISKALGLDGQGNSRASRRSSGHQRPARR